MRVSSIIYGADTGIVRRIAVSDTLDDLAKVSECGPGEALIIVDPATVGLDQSSVPDVALAQQIVQQERAGAVGETPTCAVIDNTSGEIVAVIQADPTIDSLPDATLYQAPGAMIGGTLDENGDVVPPVAVDASPDASAGSP